MSFYAINWFQQVTGDMENKFRKNSKMYFKEFEGKLYLTNSSNRFHYDCGRLKTMRLGELKKLVEEKQRINNEGMLRISRLDVESDMIISSPPPKPTLILNIIYSEHPKFADFDVSNLQNKYSDSVFLIASNFNALEAPNIKTTLDKPYFVTSYYKDHTQGPAACIGCPAATIQRCLNAGPIDMLRNFDIYHVKNGYPVLNAKDFKNKSYIDLNPDDYISVFQSDAEVSLIRKNTDELRFVKGSYVTQVFAAAVNRGQGMTGLDNNKICMEYPEIANMPLECGYETAYLVAMLEGKRRLELCLLGGGAFKNPIMNIYNILFKVHKKYQNNCGSLEVVNLRLFEKHTDMEIEKIINRIGIYDVCFDIIKV